MRRLSAFFIAAVLVPLSAWPQGNPLGPEFRVNTFTGDDQIRLNVASEPAGNFVVVWNSMGQDGFGGGIFGQRFAVSGTPLGAEFRVNTVTSSFQTFPSVASDSSGNFVVVWSGSDGAADGVFGQRFASSGTPLGGEFRVNTYTTDVQAWPAVATDPSGNFVVVWESHFQDGSEYGIFGQRYSSYGAPLGPEFRVNTHTTNPQSGSDVASDSSGNFVVTWESFGQDGPAFGVFGQRFAASGAPLGPEFRVNTYTTGQQYRESVASDPNGNFVVVWSSFGQDGFGRGNFGQRFAASGAPLGPEFRVNTYTTSYQYRPRVAVDPFGNFVVAWQSFAQDGWNYAVIGQRYESSGVPLGGEFQINTHTTGAQMETSVATDSTGRFVVAWQSLLQDGSDFGIFAQRYGPIVPVELTEFTVR